jgi:hypothetical protein
MGRYDRAEPRSVGNGARHSHWRAGTPVPARSTAPASLHGTRALKVDRAPWRSLAHHRSLLLVQLQDDRVENASAFASSCVPDGEAIYGPDASVDSSTGATLSKGSIPGSIVVEMFDWAAHQVTTMLFAIIASETVRSGYRFARRRITASHCVSLLSSLDTTSPSTPRPILSTLRVG